jgi:hypothetical protein
LIIEKRASIARVSVQPANTALLLARGYFGSLGIGERSSARRRTPFKVRSASARWASVKFGFCKTFSARAIKSCALSKPFFIRSDLQCVKVARPNFFYQILSFTATMGLRTKVLISFDA